MQLERGWTLSVAGRLEEAAAVLEAALADAGSRADDVTGQLLLRLARVETLDGRLGSALAHALDAERIFTSEQDLRGVAGALRIQGNVYAAVGRPDEAASALRRGLTIAERVGDVEEIGACLLNLGMVELELGNVGGAVELDRRAISEFERIGHGSAARSRQREPGGEAAGCRGAGRGAEPVRNPRSESRKRSGHTPTVADVQRTQARILLRQERIAEAIERAEQSEATFRQMGADAEAQAAAELAEQARRHGS